MERMQRSMTLNQQRFWGVPGWLSQVNARLLIAAQDMISGVWDGAPLRVHAGRARSLLGDSFPPRHLHLGTRVSKINKSMK